MVACKHVTGFRTALNELATAQKSAKGVSLYSRYINRPAGRILAAAAFRLRLSPNQVTAISGVLTFAAIAVIAGIKPGPGMAIGVFVAAVAGFALDSADGQLARLTGKGSLAGEWLDHVLDCAKLLAIHAAILVSFFQFYRLSHAGELLIPVAFGFVTVLMFFGGILTDQLKRRRPAERPAQPSLVRAIALLPADYGVFCISLLFLAARDAFFWVYVCLLVANTLLLGALLVKWFRELAAD
jgi:phosphatidylserine synthase